MSLEKPPTTHCGGRDPREPHEDSLGLFPVAVKPADKPQTVQRSLLRVTRSLVDRQMSRREPTNAQYWAGAFIELSLNVLQIVFCFL